MEIKVAKFGGTSLSDQEQIKKVLRIVQSDSARKYIVVSAPGKRHGTDQKITDLLLEWHKLNELNISASGIKKIIYDRFSEIINGLEVKFDLKHEMREIAKSIKLGASADYAASRGEYLNGKIIALALNFEFIDPTTCISFDENGRYQENGDLIQKILSGKVAVIPGFYGSLPNGSVKTFSRGGSDVTGAIIASAVRASVYENWTDVSGLRMTDPRVVSVAKKIMTVTYRELRELSYMGANVFHEEAMFPIQETGITTNIRNTNEPEDPGTYIVADMSSKSRGIVTGIAGRKNFTVITIEKRMMNQQIGFVRKILSVLEANDISFEHMPSGIDGLSIIIDDTELKGKHEKILGDINETCRPDSMKMEKSEIAMIAIVGQAMNHTPGVAAMVFSALAANDINIRMINQGASELSIIVGVNNNDYDTAIRVLYKSFA